MENKEDKVKQIIACRTDLGMRRGKQISQACHASISFLTNKFDNRNAFPPLEVGSRPRFYGDIWLSEEEQEWTINNRFTKICVRVDSEEEFDVLYKAAAEAGLVVHMIIDEGLTEFHGVPTKTCLAIGPHKSSRLNPITGHLKLL